MLNLLAEYIQIGRFPGNHDYPDQRRPNFLDKNGNICAVGYLVRKTSGEKLVKQINEKFQYATINEMHDPDLLNWALNSGLTLEKLATIQPMYASSGGDIAMFILMFFGTAIKNSMGYILLGGGIVLLSGLMVWGGVYVFNLFNEEKSKENEAILTEISSVPGYPADILDGLAFTGNSVSYNIKF